MPNPSAIRHETPVNPTLPQEHRCCTPTSSWTSALSRSAVLGTNPGVLLAMFTSSELLRQFLLVSTRKSTDAAQTLSRTADIGCGRLQWKQASHARNSFAYRSQTGAGLNEAKDAVESLAAKYGISPKGAGCAGMVLLLAVVVAIIGVWVLPG
jgi:hypothetical protein